MHYRSCQDALKKGDKSSRIIVNNGGIRKAVKCDHTTAGGGWTRILDVNKEIKGVNYYFVSKYYCRKQSLVLTQWN